MKKPVKMLLFMAIFAFGSQLHAQEDVLERADKNYEINEYAEAARGYEAFLATGIPDTFGISPRLANCHRHLNNLDAAVKWYGKSALQENADPVIFRDFGKVLMMLGRYDEAEKQFKKYAQSDETRGEALLVAVQFAKNAPENPAFNVAASKYNSAYGDFGTTIYKGDLIFGSFRTEPKRANKPNKNEDGSLSSQLFIAPLENSTSASGVQFLKSDFKNTLNESPVSYSADGKWAAYTRHDLNENDRLLSTSGNQMGIFLAQINQNGDWIDTKAFPFNASASGFPSLNADGTEMYFASNRDGGRGGFDIWVSKKVGQFWQSPVNVKGVNTGGDEITPFFDGSSLYFASESYVNLGGFDIFEASKTAEGFATPQNLGKNVNSSGDDFGFVYDATKRIGYLTSNRKGGKGKTDLYVVSPKISTYKIVAKDDLSLKNLALTQADVTQKGQKGALTIEKDGSITFVPDAKGTTEFTISKEGYKKAIVSLDMTSKGVTDIVLEKKSEIPKASTGGYLGLVKNANNNAALVGATVRAINQKDQSILETLTDSLGKYSLPLEKNATYVIHITKELFTNMNKNFKTLNAEKGNISEVILQPSATTGLNPIAAVKPVESKPITPVPTFQGTTTKNAFQVIQLAVQNINSPVDFSKFENLKSVGTVYAVPEDGKMKIRLGAYDTRAAADTAMKKIAKLGYNGVFIITEKNEEVTKKFAQKKMEVDVKGNQPTGVKYTTSADNKKPTDPKTPIKNTPQQHSATVTPVPKSPDMKAIRMNDKSYKVRIAALTKPENFTDGDKLKKFGEVLMVKQGKVTIVMVDGFKMLSDAKEVKARVKELGYGDAKVVVWENGEMLRVID